MSLLSSNLQRLLAPLWNKIYLIIGRSIITAISNTGEVGRQSKGSRVAPQRITVRALADENLSDLERWQEYGLETYPEESAEALLASIGGNRDQCFIICAQDYRYRPEDLAKTEVALYTKIDKTSPHRVHLKANGDVEIIADGDIKTTAANGAIENTVKAGEHFSVENGTEEVISLLVDHLTELNNLLVQLQTSPLTVDIATGMITSVLTPAVLAQVIVIQTNVNLLNTKLTTFKK